MLNFEACFSRNKSVGFSNMDHSGLRSQSGGVKKKKKVETRLRLDWEDDDLFDM